MSFFPSSVPTALQLLDARNNKSVALSADINDVITTIPVADTSNIPTAGYLTFEDGSNEIVQYTGVTPTSLTGCTRGADGTTASAHSDGGTIGMWGNAKYHNILSDEIIAIAQNMATRFGIGSTDITNVQSVIGSNLTLNISNPATSGASGSRLMLQAAGGVSSTGDAFQVFHVNNGYATIGLDFSDSGKFKIAMADAVLGNVDTLTITQSGAVTIPGPVSIGGNVYLNNGTAALPAFTWSVNPNTGIYRAGANELAFSTAGAVRVSISTAALSLEGTTRLFVPDGTVALPGFSFGGDQDTGIYRRGSNGIGITTGEVERLAIDTFGLSMSVGQIGAANGSVSLPSFTFAGDADSGIFRVGADQLGFVTGGTRAFFIGADGSINMDTGHNINFDHGTVATPGLRGGSDPNTGIYIPSSDVLAISCGGFESARFKNVSGNDDTTHIMLSVWGGGNSAVTSFIHYTTTAITTAKQIASIPNNTALVIVAGNDGTNYFRDLVMAGYGGTPTVIVSTTETGSPSARTYSNAGGGVFRVAMASGSYKTHTLLISLGGR